jgi:pectinesterase
MPLSRRGIWLGLVGLGLLRGHVAAARPAFDAVVGAHVTAALGVPVYPTLQAFLGSSLGRAAHPVNVRMAAGEHWGQVIVERPNLRLIGDGRDATFLRAGVYAGAFAPDGKAYGTFRSAVLDVRAPGFHAEDLTFENAFDAWTEMGRPGGLKADMGGSQQAIALSLGKGADRSTLLRCAVRSHQDSLFCASGRALFVDCRISGSYDFIFGGAAARFERCEIVSRPRTEPVEGYIAAPSTNIAQEAGLVFDSCWLAAEPGVPDHSVFLGRPWRTSAKSVSGSWGPDMASIGMAAYLKCVMGPHIAPAGWTRMWFGTPPQWFEPEEARFGEFGSTGPGANAGRRGAALTERQAQVLSRETMFGEWHPEI